VVATGLPNYSLQGLIVVMGELKVELTAEVKGAQLQGHDVLMQVWKNNVSAHRRVYRNVMVSVVMDGWSEECNHVLFQLFFSSTLLTLDVCHGRQCVFLQLQAGVMLQPQYHELVQRANHLAALMDAKLKIDPSLCTQLASDAIALFTEAMKTKPKYVELMKMLAMKSGGKFIEADLKGIGRAMEKAGLRYSTDWSLNKCCDVVRGAVEFDNMTQMMVFLQLLAASDPELEEDARKQGWDAEAMLVSTKIKIVRIKNRFGKMSGGGWSDCMINFAFCNSDGGGRSDFGHICEVQLVHANMMLVRNNMGAHKQYNKFRSAVELLEAVGQEEVVQRQMKADEQEASMSESQSGTSSTVSEEPG
jgi:hypothetical protein